MMFDAGYWILDGRDLSPPYQGGIKGGVLIWMFETEPDKIGIFNKRLLRCSVFATRNDYIEGVIASIREAIF